MAKTDRDGFGAAVRDVATRLDRAERTIEAMAPFKNAAARLNRAERAIDELASPICPECRDEKVILRRGRIVDVCGTCSAVARADDFATKLDRDRAEAEPREAQPMLRIVA